MVGGRLHPGSFLREHALGSAIAAAGLFWALDALVHTAGGGEGFLAHFFSLQVHTVFSRLFTVALLLSLALQARAEILRRHSEAKVRASERRFRTLADSAPVGVFECDASGRWVYVNGRASSLLGLPVSECLGDGYAKALHAEDRERVLSRWQEAVRAGEPFREECRFSPPDGAVVWAICEAAALFGGPGVVTGFIGTITNITERMHLEERLQTTAFTDELTGLFNRRGVLALAGKQMEIARRAGHAVGLVYLDVNRMKEINDRWGHKEGDRALCDAADILRETFRKSDIIGRIGGDEFVVFLPEIAAVGTRSTVLTSLRRKVADHHAHAERPFTLDLSAGVAVSAPGVPCRIEELLTLADRDMYREKRRCRGRSRPHEMPLRPDKAPRLTSRVPVEGVSAELSPGGTAAVVDIGLGGVCLGTALPLSIGSRHALKIPVGAGGGLALSAEVVWADAGGAESAGTRRFRSGLRFVNVDGQLQGALVELIAGHC